MIDYEKMMTHVKSHPFPLVFATISGAHLYGFPSPDSDYDLRGVHILPLKTVVSLEDGQQTVEKEGIYDGLEIDLVTHDAAKFFRLMLKRNGYVLEQLLSPLVVYSTPEFEELKAIAPSCLTRHHAHHYLGFAATQWKLFEKESPPRVKPLLYTFRVLLTGIHLMKTGEVQANLCILNESEKLSYLDELIDRKRTGAEKGVLDAADMAFYQGEYDRLVKELERSYEESTLPETPTGREALSDLLVRLRLTEARTVAATPLVNESTTPQTSAGDLAGEDMVAADSCSADAIRAGSGVIDPLVGEPPGGDPWRAGAYRALSHSQRMKLLMGTLSRKRYYPLAIVIGIFGILLWNAFPDRLFEQLQLDFRPTQTADTTISSVERTGLSQGGGRNGGSTASAVFRVRYSLNLPNQNGMYLGECFVQRSVGIAQRRPNHGEKIKVRYVVADPNISCMVGGTLLPFGYPGLLLVPVPIVLAGIIFWHAVARRRAAYVIAHGDYAQAKIKNIVLHRRPFPLRMLGHIHIVDFQLNEGSQNSTLQFKARDHEVAFLRPLADSGENVKLIYCPTQLKRILIVGLHVAESAAH